MSWCETLKAETVTTVTPKMNTKLKKIPEKEKPNYTCVEEFNKIIDMISDELTKIQSNGHGLFVATGDENHSPKVEMTDGIAVNVWTYYTRSKEDYDNSHKYDDSPYLINSEHSNIYAEEEEDACSLLKLIPNINTKSINTLGKGTGHGEWPHVSSLSTLHEQMGEGDFSSFSNIGGAIQMTTEWVDPHTDKNIQGWSNEDKAIYLPAMVKVIKEHADLYQKIKQMARDSIGKLGL